MIEMLTGMGFTAFVSWCLGCRHLLLRAHSLLFLFVYLPDCGPGNCIT